MSLLDDAEVLVKTNPLIEHDSDSKMQELYAKGLFSPNSVSCVITEDKVNTLLEK